jgi:hypothetical protein
MYSGLLAFVLVVLAAPHIYAQVSVDFGISRAGRPEYHPYGYGSTLDGVTPGIGMEKKLGHNIAIRAVGRLAHFYNIGGHFSTTTISPSGEVTSGRFKAENGFSDSYFVQMEGVKYSKQDKNRLAWFVFGGASASFHTYEPVLVTNLDTQGTRIEEHPDALFPGIQAGIGLTRDMSRKIDLYLQWQFIHFFPVVGQKTYNGKNDVQFPTFSIGIKFKRRS